MRIDIHISEQAFKAIEAEAALRAISHSAVIRERLDVAYGIRPQKPRRLAMRRIFRNNCEEE